MANDFSGDSNCKGLFRFESGKLCREEISDNDSFLTDGGTVAENTVNYREGACCADFEYGDSDYMYCADANLPSGWPLKSGDSNRDISVCFWFYAESLPGSTVTRYFVAKHDNNTTLNDDCFALGLRNSSGVYYIRFLLGYSPGITETIDMVSYAFVAGRWYHVGFSYDSSTKDWYCKVYGYTEGTDAEATGVSTNSIWATDVAFLIGTILSNGVPVAAYHDGFLDEIVIFNDVLTEDEIDSIRAGTYGAAVGGGPLVGPSALIGGGSILVGPSSLIS